MCEQTVASPPVASPKPEVAAAEQARATAVALLEEANANFTKVQQELSIARNNLSDAQGSFETLTEEYSALETEVANREKTLRGEFHGYSLADDVEINKWISTRATLLAGNRKSYLKAKGQITKAEHDLEKATRDEKAALDAAGDKEASKVKLEGSLEKSRQELSTLRKEIAAVTDSSDPAAEVRDLTQQIDALEAAVTNARTKSRDLANANVNRRGEPEA